MSIRQLQLGKASAAGPKIRASMFGPSMQPLYTQSQSGMDFDKDPVGISIFLNGIDKWGDPKKRVGR